MNPKAKRPVRSDKPELIKKLNSVTEQLELITTRLDLMVNLLLDIIPEERFGKPREFTPKLKHLDSTRWIKLRLRPADAGRIFGRPSKDISSRRKEIATAKPKKRKKTNKTRKNQANSLQPVKQQ